MTEKLQLNHPWMVAVWPGMGHVALNAGVYLLAKLEMTNFAEVGTGNLFDVENVEVRHGLIQPGIHPRNRLFVWTDPKGKHDLVVFLGEAQPPVGKYAFCRQLLAHARGLGGERVFTFAAMATRMHPRSNSRVFAAATDPESLQELTQRELEVLKDGHIGGLNGVLLGAAAEEGLRGACLLGEMPHIFTQVPFPKASLAILEVFAGIAGIDLDLSELAEQAQAMEEQLAEALAEMEESSGQPFTEEEGCTVAPPEEEQVGADERRRIEGLFKQSARDRSKAFELKRELDHLGLFKEYEDRFLDLFKKAS